MTVGRAMTVLEADVFDVQTPRPFDVVLAMNFSYQLFMTRDRLGGYFRRVREALVDDGILFLDAIDGHMVCHIHFAFPDGSKLRRAFSYEWRMWTLPELRELLAEAGYSKVTVYWEGTDPETGEGSGVYSPATVGDADPGWVCFLIAEK